MVIETSLHYEARSEKHRIITWLIPPDFLKRIMSTQKWETAQRVICHYDLFNQIVRLQRTISRPAFFCFKAASHNLYEDVRKSYFYHGYKFAIKAFVYSTQYFYVVDSNTQIYTQRRRCCVSTAKRFRRTRHNITLYVNCLSCSKIRSNTFLSSHKYYINHLKTKRRLLYLKTQSGPRCKHFSFRL